MSSTGGRIFLTGILVLVFWKAEAITGRAATGEAPTGGTDIVCDRYVRFLTRTMKPAAEDIARWAGSLGAEGRWPDIDYEDKAKAGWKTSRHLERLRDLALAWADSSSGYYHDARLQETIGSALDHWLEERYKNPNWWHNEIGVPRYMRDILSLTNDWLGPARLRGALEVLGQHKVRGTGANLMWSADLGIHYAALTGHEAQLEKYRDLILKEIVITTADGIQPDHSFHQHGARLQMYQYGKAFYFESVRLAWQFRGTPWAFPEEKIDLLADFTLNGWQWMARGIHTVPGTMDRSSSREGELRSADIREIIPFLGELRPDLKKELAAIAERQNGRGALEGYRYYPYSDFAAYHHKDFSFFLKTISTRTLPTESIISENLKGRLLNSGDAYLIRNGKEYYDMMPVWDWERLPGVTAFEGATRMERRPFCGSVSDGKSGLTAMDYCLENEEKQQVSARKFWAVHGTAIVCLIADLRSGNVDSPVFTALDQCLRQGAVTVNRAGKHVKWVHHSGLAYIPLTPATLEMNLREATGSWASINASHSPDPVAEQVFLPVLQHGNRPQGLSTGYILAACDNAGDARKLSKRPVWEVLRNDKECQAVQFENGPLMAAFFSPSSVSWGRHGLHADRPCLLLISDTGMYASDPAHEGGILKIIWRGEETAVQLPEDGSTVEFEL